MYWRAIVLWYFDGRTWTRGNLAECARTAAAPMPRSATATSSSSRSSSGRRTSAGSPPSTSPSLAQDADREPHFVRRADGRCSRRSRNTSDDRLQASLRRRAPARSVELVSPTDEKELQSRPATAAPDRPARARTLADQLHAPNSRARSRYVRAVLHYFQSNHFQLSTTPGRCRRDLVAEFLFSTKTGSASTTPPPLPSHARGACARAAGRRLSRRRVQPLRRLLHRQPIERPCLGRSLDRGEAQHWMRVDPDHGHHRRLAARRWRPTQGLPRRRRPFLSVADQRLPSLRRFASAWMRNGTARLRHAPRGNGGAVGRLGLLLRSGHAGPAGRGPWLCISNAARALGICVLVRPRAGGALVAFFFARQQGAVARGSISTLGFCRRMAQRGVAARDWEGPLAYTDRVADHSPSRRSRSKEPARIVAEHRYAPGDSKPRRLKDLDALRKRSRPKCRAAPFAKPPSTAMSPRCAAAGAAQECSSPWSAAARSSAASCSSARRPATRNRCSAGPSPGPRARNSSAGSRNTPASTKPPSAPASTWPPSAAAFPASDPTGGDRVPDPDEILNCSGWMKAEMDLLQPRPRHRRRQARHPAVHAVRKARRSHRHDLPAQATPGTRFDLVPLPHPSGASPWPHQEPGRMLLPRAMELIAGHPAWRESVLRHLDARRARRASAPDTSALAAPASARCPIARE